jgi:hypothetical protein
MDEIEFRLFLKRQRRKATAIEQIVMAVATYQEFVANYYPTRTLDQTNVEMLESYIFWLESETGDSASKPLWAIRYYFDFIEKQELSDLSGQMRSERIKRKPFYIRKFRGVNATHVSRLEALYIENIDQLIDEARTPRLRNKLSERTGIPLDGILELVKLCDLSRLGAVRTVRARLYHDAGLTPEIIATWDPDALQAMLSEWVEQNDFEGIAPQPKEVQNLVENAKELPKLVIY